MICGILVDRLILLLLNTDKRVLIPLTLAADSFIFYQLMKNENCQTHNNQNYYQRNSPKSLNFFSLI